MLLPVFSMFAPFQHGHRNGKFNWSKVTKAITLGSYSPTEEQQNKRWDYPKNHDTITQRAAVKSVPQTCWDHGCKAFPKNAIRAESQNAKLI